MMLEQILSKHYEPNWENNNFVRYRFLQLEISDFEIDKEISFIKTNVSVKKSNYNLINNFEFKILQNQFFFWLILNLLKKKIELRKRQHHNCNNNNRIY